MTNATRITTIMRVEIKRLECPNFSTDLADCARCLVNNLSSATGAKPSCFKVVDDGTQDVVVWIKAGDTFASVAAEQPRLISVTDWLS